MHSTASAAPSVTCTIDDADADGTPAAPVVPPLRNPVLPGFNPDPSILRVGEDYYLATSTFEWYPAYGCTTRGTWSTGARSAAR